MAEEQFLARELGCVWTQVDRRELVSILDGPDRHLVLCSDPTLYADIVTSAAPDSLLLFLISDEAYDAERQALTRAESVGLALRHYAAEPSSPTEIAAAVAGFLRDARGSSTQGRTALPLLRGGLAVRRRMLALRGARTLTVPLGYTSVFASAVAPGTGSSLFLPSSTGFIVDVDPRADRPISISFRGNRGMPPRVQAVETLARIEGSRVTLIEGAWSGAGASESARDYVSELSQSRFALCPPGFVNNESFRFYEVVICGALPIEITTALTHLGRVPFRDGITIREATWAAAVKRAVAMSEKERIARVERARTLITEELGRVATVIQRLVSDR